LQSGRVIVRQSAETCRKARAPLHLSENPPLTGFRAPGSADGWAADCDCRSGWEGAPAGIMAQPIPGGGSDDMGGCDTGETAWMQYRAPTKNGLKLPYQNNIMGVFDGVARGVGSGSWACRWRGGL